MHAEYDRESDEYIAHRVLQAFDTAQFIHMTSGGADLVILGGDLNTEPDDLAYQVLLLNANLHDAYHQTLQVSLSAISLNRKIFFNLGGNQIISLTFFFLTGKQNSLWNLWSCSKFIHITKCSTKIP